VDPPAGHLDPIQDHRILDRTGAVAGTRAVRRLFIADIVGVYDVYQQSVDVTLKESIQLPVNDPLLLVSAMAAVTRNLGFGLTANLTYEPPYLFARRMSTLDHLSRGRVGWNIVTGYLDSAAKAMGLSEQVEHDRRYDQADEYLEVLYKLWEGSWENGAVLNDRGSGSTRSPRRCTRSSTRASSIRSRVTTSASRRRSARRCCSRPAVPIAACCSPGAMPSACSSAARTNRRPKCRWTRSAPAPSKPGATRGHQGVHGPQRDRRRNRRTGLAKHAEYLSYASAEAGVAHFSASTGIDFSEYASTNRSST
jgi:hypothetical protein